MSLNLRPQKLRKLTQELKSDDATNTTIKSENLSLKLVPGVKLLNTNRILPQNQWRSKTFSAQRDTLKFQKKIESMSKSI